MLFRSSLSGGSLWQNPPTVSFVGTPTGTGATFSSTLASQGGVAQINVSNGGSGYELPPIVNITGNGVGATATSVLSTTDGSAVGLSYGPWDATNGTQTGTVTLSGTSGETDIVLNWSASGVSPYAITFKIGRAHV